MAHKSSDWDKVVYWALDLETGGLDPKSDAILAVGMVPVRGGAVMLGEGWRTLVRPEADKAIHAASIPAHQLVPGEVTGAPPLAGVLDGFEARLGGEALLVHQASVDVAFLERAYRTSRRRWPKPVVVDTVDLLLKLAHKSRFATRTPDRVPALNLSDARRELGLPSYPEHDALTDATATAELFLVLRHKLGATRLRDLV